MSRPETNKARKNRVKHINTMIAKGDRRSFNEIDADIELQNWTEKFNPNPTSQRKEKKP